MPITQACRAALKRSHERRAEATRALHKHHDLDPVGNYDDKESLKLHRQRLVEGYAAACERLPRGYTMSFATWIATIGDAGTLWKDEHWLNTRLNTAAAARAGDWLP